MYFLYFTIIFSWKKATPFIWIKNALCQVWLKVAQWFWKRRWKCEKFTDRQIGLWGNICFPVYCNTFIKNIILRFIFSIPVYWQRCLLGSEFRFGLNWNPLWKYCIQITKCLKLLQYTLFSKYHLIHSPTDGQTDGQMDGKQ